MRAFRLSALLVAPLLFTAGCASTVDGPSLSPRAAEAIDPRLPVPDNSGTLPADPALAAQLSALRQRALTAAAPVGPALEAAAGVASTAGPAESESWIAAQQALSAAIAVRAPFAGALGDLDTLAAARARSGGRLVPRDLEAIEAVAAELAAIDRRHAEAIEAIQRRLQR